MSASATVAAAKSRLAVARHAMSLSKRGQLESLLMPAAKAYLLGYVLDILPAILKVVLRYIALELKRIRALEKRLLEERKIARESSSSSSSKKSSSLMQTVKIVAPSLYQVPDLLRGIVAACAEALGPSGMAVSCFIAMAGWRISESLVWWPIAKYYALKLSFGATTSETTTRLLTRARVLSTFVAASLSSAMAMMILQHQTRAAALAKAAGSVPNIKMLPADPSDWTPTTTGTAARWMPRARSSLSFWSRSSTGQTSKQASSRIASLAPAGHFLSRLTSLSIPSTPKPFGGSMAAASPQAPASPTNAVAPLPPQPTPPPVVVSSSGKPSPTIDLTLFALVRALDTLVRAITSTPTPTTSQTTAKRTSWLGKAAAGVRNQAQGLIFVVCCAQIMWAWFYHPERLPPSYVKWITNLATMDERLLMALRSIRRSEPLRWNYQLKDMTPEGVHLLGSLAEELGHPYQWGDPTRLPNTLTEARTMIAEARRQNDQLRAEGKPVVPDAHRETGAVPGFVLNGAAGPRGRGEMAGMPCELVHCGVGGASCYRNALLRWIRGWRMSMAIYFPVHLLPRLLFNPKAFFRAPLANLLKVLLGAARSAAFLATFIVGNWFPICLGRTALLPRLFPNVPFRFWDGGLGPRMGSIACGFSIFIEEKRKRAEMALYVAPRALFAMAESAHPGWLSQGQRSAVWVERVVFGAAVGTVVAAGRYRPDLLRGITATMGWVARPVGQQSAHRNYARR